VWDSPDGLRFLSQALTWLAFVLAVLAGAAAVARYFVDRRANELKTAALLGRVPPADRALSEEAEASLAAQLATVPETYSVVALAGDQEAMKFASQLCVVLRRARWPTAVGCYGLASYGGPLEGVWIWATTEKSQPAAAKLADLLDGAGIAASVSSATCAQRCGGDRGRSCERTWSTRTVWGSGSSSRGRPRCVGEARPCWGSSFASATVASRC
jgi:hypothetical protein